MNRRDVALGALLALAALTHACGTSPVVQAGRPLHSQIIGAHYDTVALCILERLDATGRVWLMGASFVDDQAAQRARISMRSANPLAGPGAVKPYSGRVDPGKPRSSQGLS